MRANTGGSCHKAMIVETSVVNCYLLTAEVERTQSKYDANYLAGR